MATLPLDIGKTPQNFAGLAVIINQGVIEWFFVRFVKDPVLWACLAGLAVHSKQLDTAEVAYAAIQEADKVLRCLNEMLTVMFSEQVYYIQYIKELPLKEARAAEMAVMTGHYQDAENLLLQSGLIFRAVLLNIYLHQWERALDLAVKVLMDTSW